MRRAVPRGAVTGLAAIALVVLAGGSAFAVSGGGYSSPNQDCPWYGSGWNTPPDQTYPGCHQLQFSVESGGTTNGNPNDGYNNSKKPGDHGSRNTTWVSTGVNQVPQDPKAAGTPGLLSIGSPGQSTSPHAGCIAVNTDGTDGGPAPAGTKSAPPSKAGTQKDGCGNNPNGLGFSLSYDYYNYYCPLAAATPFACETIPGGDTSPTKLTVDKGSKQNVTDVATKGVILYFGMDDNFDNGEHDGEGPGTSRQSAGSVNGPSDGGAEVVSLTPQNATKTPSLTNPVGLVNESLGFCADGNCIAVTTQKETVYQGCGANTGNNQAADKCAPGKQSSQRDVYDYSGKQWDPYNCSSGGNQGSKQTQPDSPQACDTSSSNPSPSGSKNSNGGLDYWRSQEAHSVNAEPGVQFYEDPDAEGSPAVPIYPNPALYAGTCGVVVGGGQAPAAPASPVTNRAGQLDVSTGC